MRKMFPGFYPLTEDEFTRLWREGIFAFDANVLLNIYRYTPPTVERLFDILGRLKDRIWVPHQAALEYQEQRLDTIADQMNAYDILAGQIRTQIEKLEAAIRAFPNHAYISDEPLIVILHNARDEMCATLRDLKEKHPDIAAPDRLRDTITISLDGKVGQPYPKAKLAEIHKQAEDRFKDQIPPGYKDNGKEGNRKYGDVVIWFQLLDYAKAHKNPIVFVTDDQKEDWWIKYRGHIIGPRSELIQEMADAGVLFYMYQSDQFLAHAETFLGMQEHPAAIEEVRDVLEDAQTRQHIDEGQTALLGSWPSEIGAFRQALTGLSLPSAVDAINEYLRSQEATRDIIRGLVEVPGQLATDAIGEYLEHRQAISDALRMVGQPYGLTPYGAGLRGRAQKQRPEDEAPDQPEPGSEETSEQDPDVTP